MVKIIVVSSFAKDSIFKAKDRIDVREGGPALFIKRALDDMDIEYELITGESGNVDIEIIDGEEIGRIRSVPKIDFKPKAKPDLLLVSTLSDEYNLKAAGEFNCLDIQGYVRGKEGSKKVFDDKEIMRFDIIKGTEEEFRYIPQNIKKNIGLTLITKGKDGFEIIDNINNKRRYYKPNKKITCNDNIGAGDTFFAAFCIRYFQSREIDKSAIFARDYVERFLEEKR